MAISYKRMGIAAFAGAASALCALGGGAFAASVTEPGATLGSAAGAQVPEGVYFFNNINAGNNRTFNDISLDVEIPVIIWGTPYKILGGQVIVAAAAPAVSVGIPATTPGGGNYIEALYNPELTIGLSWDIGNGFFISQTGGIYAPNTGTGVNEWVPEYRAAITYLKDGWNLTANAILGFPQGVQNSPYNTVAFGPFVQANEYINVDLTAVKTLGKWQIGLVAFGSSDLNRTAANVAGEQSQFAVGGLVGYDFGPVTVSFYLTHDVYVHNYGPINAWGYRTEGTEDTRIWSTLFVPLWVAPKEVSMKDMGYAGGSLKDAPVLPTWAGGYIGINTGYAWSEVGRGAYSDYGYNYYNNNGYDFDGSFVGFQAGFNWQTGPFVYGIEADIQGAGNAINGLFKVTGPTTFGPSAVVNDWGTVRGRVGYAWGPALLYATGGFAWGDVAITAPSSLTLQQGFTPTGWAAGGGLEYKIAPNWAAKLEYQFIDFGTETANRSWAFPWPARQDFNFSTAKLGLNWYINYPETAPLK